MHYITAPDRATGGTDCCCGKQDSDVSSPSGAHSLLPWMMSDKQPKRLLPGTNSPCHKIQSMKKAAEWVIFSELVCGKKKTTAQRALQNILDLSWSCKTPGIQSASGMFPAN
jgi:hypothetical protein